MIGCYKDAGRRAMKGKTITDNRMTNEMCNQKCGEAVRIIFNLDRTIQSYFDHNL